MIVGLVVVAGWLLFNNSSNDMLRQFRLEALLSQAEANKGSGSHPLQPHRARPADRRRHACSLGAGPGQAEGIIGSGTDALGISNLHNWWLETYADGGLVGFALHLIFFLLLVIALWPVAAARPRPADALPGLRRRGWRCSAGRSGPSARAAR